MTLPLQLILRIKRALTLLKHLKNREEDMETAWLELNFKNQMRLGLRPMRMAMIKISIFKKLKMNCYWSSKQKYWQFLPMMIQIEIILLTWMIHNIRYSKRNTWKKSKRIILSIKYLVQWCIIHTQVEYDSRTKKRFLQTPVQKSGSTVVVPTMIKKFATLNN